MATRDRRIPGSAASRDRTSGARTSAKAAVALILLGVLLLALLLVLTEGLLSVTGVGPSHRLFLRAHYCGEELYQLNREISQLFFPAWVDRPLAHELLAVQKSPRAYRILATGASTTMGDPFGYQTAFPALLREMLGDVAPRRDYEIANCACIAISSLDVLLIHRRALDYEPDAILIYTGHNEAYGADGIDTPVQRSFQSRAAAKFWLWFRNLRLVRLVRGLVAPGAPPDGTDAAQEGFGMWVMRDRLVPSESEKHARMLRFYRENILEMLDAARAAGVDVILCTLISNLRDQCPMGAVHRSDLTEEARAAWEAAFARGVAASEEAARAEADDVRRDAWETGREALDRACQLDPAHAIAHFRLGRCLDALGDSAAALREYRRARDLDPVHFRACSAQNEILRQIARSWEPRGRHELVLVDLDSLLYTDYPRGPGADFFTEHVHPYPVGHAWMARKIAEGLAESPWGEALGPWDFSRLDELPRYPARAGMTALDLAAGLILTDLHKLAKWPFTSCYDNVEARAALQARIDSLGRTLGPFEREIFGGIPTDRTGDYYDYGQRHYALFTRYRAQRRGPEALRELRRARDYWPPLAFVETDMAQILVGMRRLGEAAEHLACARQLDPDYAPIHFVTGALHHSRGELKEAARAFRRYLELEPEGPYATAAARGLQVLGAPTPPR
ncbi:MAG: tetratricopeptide repeat protein [Candidatus Eisenbacteria bacterium]|nr:tetratricopeptide repeat protein [Candidatus Eisenbacteria bacterium]